MFITSTFFAEERLILRYQRLKLATDAEQSPFYLAGYRAMSIRVVYLSSNMFYFIHFRMLRNRGAGNN